MGGAHATLEVWQTDLGQPAAVVEAAAARLLAPAEHAALGAARPEVRHRRFLGRVALRVVLGRELGCEPRAVPIVAEPQAKPTLGRPTADGRRLDFSLSRSADRCLIALSRVGPVGVDLEEIVPFAGLESVVANRMAPPEAAAILGLRGAARVRAFYDCWTRKEACLKATGMGIAGLDRVRVTVGPQEARVTWLADDDARAWSLARVDAGPGMAACVAVRSGISLTTITSRRLDPLADITDLGVAAAA